MIGTSRGRITRAILSLFGACGLAKVAPGGAVADALQVQTVSFASGLRTARFFVWGGIGGGGLRLCSRNQVSQDRGFLRPLCVRFYVVRHSIQYLLPAPAAAVVPSSPQDTKLHRSTHPTCACRRVPKLPKPSAWGPLGQVSEWGKGSSGVSHEITHAFGEKGGYLVTSDRSRFPNWTPELSPGPACHPTGTRRNYANCVIWWGVLWACAAKRHNASNGASFRALQSLHIRVYRKEGR